MLEKGFTVPALSQPALPPAASWFPLPSGWIVLGFLLIAVLAIFLFFHLARWRRNLWRREALATLTETETVDDWLALIKQIQLVHHPRQTISHHLSAQSILQDLPLDEPLKTSLCEKYCQRDNRLDSELSARLHLQLKHWLKELPDV